MKKMNPLYSLQCATAKGNLRSLYRRIQQLWIIAVLKQQNCFNKIYKIQKCINFHFCIGEFSCLQKKNCMQFRILEKIIPKNFRLAPILLCIKAKAVGNASGGLSEKNFHIQTQRLHLSCRVCKELCLAAH